MRPVLVLLSLFICLAVLMIMRSDLEAQPLSTPANCDTAVSTADVLACLKEQHENAQNTLNMLYGKISGALRDEELSAFRAAQQNWIAYRDQECRWEQSREETQSLRRVQELSCLTRLTNLRSEVLAHQIKDTSIQGIRKMSPFPGWMNVLAENNPDIYWKHAGRLQVDLDCDGLEEDVMSGISIDPDPEKGLRPVVAIADNPFSGRPRTQLMSFDVSSSQSLHSLCSPHIILSAVPDTWHPARKAPPGKPLSSMSSEEAERHKICRAGVIVHHGDCTPLIIFADGINYQRNYQPEWDAQAAHH